MVRLRLPLSDSDDGTEGDFVKEALSQRQRTHVRSVQSALCAWVAGGLAGLPVSPRTAPACLTLAVRMEKGEGTEDAVRRFPAGRRKKFFKIAENTQNTVVLHLTAEIRVCGRPYARFGVSELWMEAQGCAYLLDWIPDAPDSLPVTPPL